MVTPYSKDYPGTMELAVRLLKRHPRRSLAIFGLLVLASLSEAVGAASLLPLLAVLGDFGQGENALYQIVTSGFNSLNIPITLGSVLLVIVVLIILKSIFTLIATRSFGYAIANMAYDLRLRFLHGLMNARWSYFTALPLGYATNAISSESERAVRTYANICQIAAEGFTVCFYLLLVFLISWKLTIIAIIGGLALMGGLYGFLNMMKEAGRAQTKHMADLSKLMTDSIGSLKVIKAMGRERHFIHLLDKESSGMRQAKRKQVFANQSRQAFIEPIIVILIAAGIFLSQAYSDIAMGSMLTFAFMFLRIITKMAKIQTIYQKLLMNESAFWAIERTIEQTCQADESWHGKKDPKLDQSISFKNLNYHHEINNHSKKTFNKANVSFPAGQFSAVIGPSGVGKTTMVDIILGFYIPQSGQVCVDEVPLHELDLLKWRQMIGYVPQSFPLLHDTVYNNITMGRRDIEADDVWKILDIAGAKDFILELPNGIDEMVGEKGQRFSGGQQQRIAIARALVTKPKLLILDEATSSLDKDTEKGFLDTINTLQKEMNITVIAISHAQMIKNYADKLYKISNGKIHEVSKNTAE